MILHTDIPTRDEIDRLLRTAASPACRSTSPPASSGEPERIEFKTLAAQAASRPPNAGAGTQLIRVFDEEIGFLDEDDEFWRHQARSLAAFATPEWLITFRLPNRLLSQVVVSDRFHLRPLLRTVTFPHVAFVLALAAGSVRLVEVTPDLPPTQVKVDGCRRTPPARSGNRRSPTAHRPVVCRARKGRRSACTNTRGRSTGRSGRCSTGSMCP